MQELDRRLIARMLDAPAERLERLEREIAEATGFSIGDFVRVDHDSFIITSFSWAGPPRQKRLLARMKNRTFWTSRSINDLTMFRDGGMDIPYWALEEDEDNDA